MNRPILHASMILVVSLLGQIGCQQAAKTEMTAAKPKPQLPSSDPTSWSSKDVTRDESDPTTSQSGLAKSSGLVGSMSSEGQDIEKSLGVGRR